MEKDDGKISRLIYVADDKMKKQMKYLFAKETKKELSDGHLWLSVFIRPVQSTFTRLDRVTCCFVLLYITMLMNILYYGQADTSSSDAVNNQLQIGPLTLTPQQISIGVISNLIIFGPSLLLVQLFRRSRRRESRTSKIKSLFDKQGVKQSKYLTEVPFAKMFLIGIMSPLPSRASSPRISPEPFPTTPKSVELSSSPVLKESTPLQKSKRKLKKFSLMVFPWWMKIVAYVLSFIFASISIIFIIFKGISLGDATVKKWLTSFLFSVITSVTITQPLQIALIVLFFVTVCRKSTSSNLDNEYKDAHEKNEQAEIDSSLSKTPKIVVEEENSDSDDETNLSNLKMQIKTDAQDEKELRKMKARLRNEKKSKKIIREILYLSSFLLLLYGAAYSNRDPNSFDYAKNLRNLFINNDNYNKVSSNLCTLKRRILDCD